jgi:hypothetical protein
MEALLFPALCSQFFLISSYKFHCNVVFVNESSFQEGECSQPPKNARKQPEVHVSSDAHDCQVWRAHAGTGNIPCHGQRMTEACCLQNNVVWLVAPFLFIGMCRHMG